MTYCLSTIFLFDECEHDKLRQKRSGGSEEHLSLLIRMSKYASHTREAVSAVPPQHCQQVRARSHTTLCV